MPKAVESTVIERHSAKQFEIAVAEMNGWRGSMEDAHLVHTRDDYGVFGVFDGHGGGACSEFVAERLTAELEKNGCPKDDAAVKKIFLDTDKEFLDSDKPSGSTATMCIVRKPAKAGDKHLLHVVNAGDSRVLLGRRDGTIVDGGGTDEGLTKDHKPDDPSERERIERCGGRVEHEEGNCARVNGNLAVSRGFGDRDEKKTGGPGQEDRPVTANPEMGHFECDEADFLLLVCDGVSEGNFPNPQVVELVAKLLKEGKNIGEAAKAVCDKALATDSKDNVTCMIVLLSGTDDPQGKTVEFIPGPISNMGHKGFRTASEAMVKKTDLTLAKTCELRYEALEDAIAAGTATADMQEEAGKIGKVSGAKGSDERTKWFEKWLEDLPEEKESGPGGMDMDSIQQMMGGKGGGKGGMGGGGGKGKQAPEPKEEEEEERTEDGYAWSQKGEEVQILFKLEKPVTKKDVKVKFAPGTLEVTVDGGKLLGGSLGGKVDTDECTWCIANGGNELQVMLTKRDAKDAWKALLK